MCTRNEVYNQKTWFAPTHLICYRVIVCFCWQCSESKINFIQSLAILLQFIRFQVKTSWPCDRMAAFAGRYLFRLYRENDGLGFYLISLIISFFTFVQRAGHKQLFSTHNSSTKIRLKTNNWPLCGPPIFSCKDTTKVNGM